MPHRETEPAFYRPKERPYKDMTNEELQLLFELRASKVKVDPKGFWDDRRIVYWDAMMPLLKSLHEIMLEIQARYPKREIMQYAGAHVRKLLPLSERQWSDYVLEQRGTCSGTDEDVAEYYAHIELGLKESVPQLEAQSTKVTRGRIPKRN